MSGRKLSGDEYNRKEIIKKRQRHLNYLGIIRQQLVHTAQLALERVLLLACGIEGLRRSVALVQSPAQTAERPFQVLLVALQTLHGAGLLVQQLIELVQLLHLALHVRK